MSGWVLCLLLPLAAVGLLSVPLTFQVKGRLQTEEQRVEAKIAWGGGVVAAVINIDKEQKLFRLRLAVIRLPTRCRAPKTARDMKKRQKATRQKERRGLPFSVNQVLNRKLLVVALNFLRRILRSLKLRIRLRGIYGTGDPASTGMLAGLIAVLNAGQINLNLEADYTGPALDLAGEASGRIIPVLVLGCIVRFLLAGPVRKLWLDFIKVKLSRKKIKEGAQYV